MESKKWESVTLWSPDGDKIEIPHFISYPKPTDSPQSWTFLKIMSGSTVIGGIHNLPNQSNTKLRLSLARTATKPRDTAPAPAGDWRIEVNSDSPVNLWILRDDRDETGRIPSVFSHPNYRERLPDGRYGSDGTNTGNIRRSGTASVYTTASVNSTNPPPVSVTATELSDRKGMHQLPASYSGKQMDGTDFANRQLVDCGEPFDGQPAVHNGTSVIMERFSGTSAAATMAASRLGKPPATSTTPAPAPAALPASSPNP